MEPMAFNRVYGRNCQRSLGEGKLHGRQCGWSESRRRPGRLIETGHADSR
ncbi:hypothetical protein JB92DRAFT_2906692 [Gautieria morchelliformis]|nr:hypothetical protein JB92DRAFT_2906692 [Gautieria morchelliformis]